VTDPERDHFVRQIRDLERSRGRWRLASLVLAGLLALPIVCGGLAGVWWVPRLRYERAREEADRLLEDVERARADEAEFRDQTREARRQLQEAEKAFREAEQHLGTSKE
jgi:hypothetical protein